MKTKISNINDFELEKIDRGAQKVIRGGDGDPVDPTNNPAKGSGNGSG
ncbi:hypothetical protein [Flavobacterium ginsenosidimutans]|uniref:Bacteriocin n=1 Tax=Flavobacterium ginsenosidimutans TaxID=687844 RepID=A0ABZ2QHK7_9FLAO|nr:hypothetical protein [Flavobacterium ginsenosidimutans]KAF2332277.1 hypothetical protein DM444_09960 [Flavobacterium ginsenosidimutans]